MTEPPVTDASSRHDHRAFLKRRLMVNTGAAVITNLWAIVVSVAVVPVLLAGLGTEQFGVWAIMLTFSAVTGWFSLADLGVSVAASNALAAAHAAADRAAMTRTASSTVWFFGAAATASGLVFVGAGTLVVEVTSIGDDHPSWRLGGVVAWVGVQIAADLLARSSTTILDGLQRVDLARLLDSARRTAVAAATGIAATTAGTLRAVAMAAALASLAGLALSLVISRSVTEVHLRGGARASVVELLRAGAPIAVLRPLGVIHRVMDRIVVAAVIGPIGVAAVEVASSLQNGADAVLSASSYSVTPTAAYLDGGNDRAGLRALLVRATKVSLLATLPVAVFIVVLGGPIVEVWLGDDRPDDSALLVALAGTAIALLSLAAVASNLLVGIGHSRSVLTAALGSIVVNLVCSIWLAIAIGTPGVFVATILGSLYVVPALWGAALRATGTPMSELVGGALIRGVVPSAVLATTLATIMLVVDGAWTRLGVGAALGGAAVTAVTFGYGLSAPERRAIVERLRRAKPSADSPRRPRGPGRVRRPGPPLR